MKKNDTNLKIKKIANRIHKKIVAFQKMDKRWRKNLLGACATASYLLHKALKRQGVESWMVHSCHKKYGNHVWVETPDNLIDLTYSQFDESKGIIIINKNDPKIKSYYKNFKNMLNLSLDSMTYFKWPASQDPIKCHKRMKKYRNV